MQRSSQNSFAWTSTIVLTVAIFVIPAMLYWPSIEIGFNSDDFAYAPFFILTIPELINAIGRIYEGEMNLTFFRPIGYLIWRIDYSLWGWNPDGYHITNILLHSINAVLLFFLARKLGLDKFGAAAAALFFGLYPAGPEAVSWISGRFDVFSLTWLLASLLLWCEGRIRDDRRYLGWSLAAFKLAILTKETPLAALLLLPILDWLINTQKKQSNGKGPGWAWKWYFGFLAVIVTVVLIRLALFRDISGYHDQANRCNILYSDFETVWNNLVQDLWMLITPIHRTLWAEWPPLWRDSFPVVGGLAGVALVGGLIWAAMLARKGDQSFLARYVLGLAWMVLLTVPSLTISGVWEDLYFARYIYHSAAGLALCIGITTTLAWSCKQTWRPVAALMLVGILVLSGFALNRHIGIWVDVSRYTHQVYNMLDTHSSRLPDGSTVFIVNLRTDWDGVHFGPMGYASYLDAKYGVKDVRVHFVDRHPYEVYDWWGTLVSGWRRPAVGFLWDDDRKQMLLLPPVDFPEEMADPLAD